MQIGLTVRKSPPATIAGTRLRGVAEAAGFRLSPTGRFEWVQDDTGAVLFTLQNVTDEAFTAESLRAGATAGVVFLLDVPRVADPPRAFDQMKLAAKRMAQTVGGELVDDNGRLLNDAGLAAIREHVRVASVEAGSPISARSRSSSRARYRPLSILNESSMYGSLINPFQPTVVRGFSKYPPMMMNIVSATSSASFFTRPAYSRAALRS